MKESDPYKQMGVPPNAPGKDLEAPVRHRSNPETSTGSSFSKCKGCGKITAPSEMADLDFCKSCDSKKKICSVCNEEFYPEESYYHRCPKCQKAAYDSHATNKTTSSEESINNSCPFCKDGKYSIYVNPSTNPQILQKVHKLGLKTIAKNEWKILVCDKCGNVQLFRPDIVNELL